MFGFNHHGFLKDSSIDVAVGLPSAKDRLDQSEERRVDLSAWELS